MLPILLQNQPIAGSGLHGKSIIISTIFSQIKKRGCIFRYREYKILFYKPVFSCQYMYYITFENVVLEKEDQFLSFSMACYKITINVIV